MKKSILIALAVALATGAQGQVDEWVNPFKGYGAYDYVQKQSKHEKERWFLMTTYIDADKLDKYPTLASYDNETFVKMRDNYYSLVIILQRPQKLDKRYINVDLKYNAIHLDSNGEKTSANFLTARISFIDLVNGEKEKDLFDNLENLEGYTCNHTKYLNSSANGAVATATGNSKYICIVLSGTNSNADGYCLINNIEITFRDNDYNSGYDPNISILKKYFYEPYYMDENGNIHSKNETITSITNTMESNIYVSNNVLHTDEPSSVYIFNAGGILVKTENNTTSVDLSDLKKGVYIAKVNGKPVRFIQ